MHLKDGVPEIGYWIAEPFSGKGVVTRTTKALTDFGINQLGLTKIMIRARQNNAPSKAIPPKLGYVFDHVMDDKNGPLNVWLFTAPNA